VEGKDGGGQASPFLSISLSPSLPPSLYLSLPLQVKTCAVVVLLMVVVGGPDSASLWVDLAPRWLGPALAACRLCRHT